MYRERTQKSANWYISNNIQSALSAGGGKEDVKASPKCIHPNCNLAQQTILALDAVGRLWPSDYDDDYA